MKNIFISLFFIVAIYGSGGSLCAEDAITLGACEHKIASGNGYGTDVAGEVHAALYVPSSKLSNLGDNAITRVDVGLISRINVRELTVWVRETLDGANLAEGRIERGQIGWNKVLLNTPYLIEKGSDMGVFIGYSFIAAGVSHPVSVVGDDSGYESYFKNHSNDNWNDLTSKGILSIEAIVTGDHLPQYDLALTEGTMSPSLKGDGDNNYIVTGKVSNLALKPVSGFTIVAVDEQGCQSASDVSVSVPQGETVSFSVNLQSQEPLVGNIMLSVASLHDGEDADMRNNTVETRLSFLRNVLIEEFTTESCSNCPGAAEMLHTLLENPDFDGRAVAVCHHSAFGIDWLTRDIDNELTWMFDMNGSAFAPAMMFDRRPLFKYGLNQDRLEPIVAPRSEKILEECLAASLAVPAHAMLGMEIAGIRELADGSEITVVVDGICDDIFAMENPMINFLILEDNVEAKNQQGAAKTPYYHNHVIRLDNGAWGESLEFTNSRFSRIFAITLNNDWKRDNIYFVAFIANRDSGNVGNNVVENTAWIRYDAYGNGTTSSSEIMPTPVVEVARYDLNGMSLNAPSPGMNIVVFSDGSRKKVFIWKI